MKLKQLLSLIQLRNDISNKISSELIKNTFLLS